MTKKTAGRKAANASCTATTNAGEPCTSPAMVGTTICMMHSDDPLIAQRAHIARTVGMKLAQMKGKYLKAGITLATPSDWLMAISSLTNDLALQPNTPARVSTFCALSKEARAWFLVNEAMEGRVIEVEG